MADTVEDAVQVAPEVEQEARALGWVPPDEFRGDKAKYVGAEEFLERGRVMLPLVRQHAKKLEGTVAQQAAELKRLRDEQAAARESLTAMEEFYREDTKRQVEQERRRLTAALKQAKKDGDVDLEVDLQEQLTGLRTPVEPVKKPAAAAEPAPAKPLDPQFVAWLQQPENAWYGTDMARTYRALSVAQQMHDSGKFTHLQGAAFMAQVVKEMEDAKPAAQPKVGGGRPTGSGGGSGGGRKGYSDLPPEAKEACARQAKKVVGQGRAFAKDADWQDHYAKIYFQGEEA